MNVSHWKASLHGGHSGAYSEHAVGTLTEILDAAVAAGFTTYGLSEHAPRTADRFLYSGERARGWTVATLESNFQRYAAESRVVAAEFAPRLAVLRGFEAEIVPESDYRELMLGLRARYEFDYMVGSAHYVGEHLIDSGDDSFEIALRAAGGLEPLCVAYYNTVARMVRDLGPEVVGHFDVIGKNGRRFGRTDTPAVRDAVRDALAVVRDRGSILDLNTAGYRKGLGHPYPARWIVEIATDMGIGFCFGDDSHGPDQVGQGIEEARNYLTEIGVETVTTLEKRGGELRPLVVSLK